MHPAVRALRGTAILGILTLALGGCDLFGPDNGPPAELDVARLGTALEVGEEVDVSITVLDDAGEKLSGETVTFTASGDGSTDPATTTSDETGVASTAWTLGTTAGPQTLSIATGSIDTTLAVEVRAAALDRLDLDPVGDTLTALGDSLTLSVDGFDRYGNDVALAWTAWSSSDPAVASVTDGVVVAHGEGVVEITATSREVSGTSAITVDQVVVGIDLYPGAPVMVIGETLDVTVEAVDARGAAVDTALSLSWTSDNTAVATVSGSGVVTAQGNGITTVTATAGPFTGQATVDVRIGPRPSISDIQPALLGAGDTATISGADFGTDPSVVEVTVAGVATDLLTVTDGQLTVALPPPEAFPCAPTGDGDVVVDVDGLDTSAPHLVAGAAQHPLPVGSSVALTGGDVACNELTEPGTYVLSVFNASTSPVSTTGFQLRGSSADAATAGDRVRPRIEAFARQPQPEPAPEADAHYRILEQNRRLVEELGGPGRRSGAVDARLAAETVGELRTFRIPNLDESDICAGYIEVTARAVFVGDNGVIWEDTLAPLAGEMDARWNEIGAEYDNVMHQLLLDNFGDPLAFDDQLDGNGLFYMLFSEVVNDFEEAAVSGFVFSGDFYSRNLCAASDHGEIFYGRVATRAGDGYDSGRVGDWAWRMRSTVIHEVKHLTAYANKFDVNPSNPNLEEPGLEEATARLAEEFFGRALQGYGQAGNVTYDESIDCERRVGPANPVCDEVPVIMAKHYSGINEYMKTPALLSPFGRVDGEDFSFYGSGWQWVRWAVDHSGIAEPDFIKPLIREPTLTGPANLADKAGRTIPEMLADYTLALAIDDHPSGTVPDRAQLTLPSWDTRDIFQGLHDAYAGTSLASTYPTPWPLATQGLAGGAFQVDVPAVRGGAAALFELSGTTGAQLLELLSAAGGTAPQSLGLAIVRIQ